MGNITLTILTGRSKREIGYHPSISREIEMRNLILCIHILGSSFDPLSQKPLDHGGYVVCGFPQYRVFGAKNGW